MSSSFFKKLWNRAKVWLRVDLPADGLEISDHALRWCCLRDGIMHTTVLPLSPGVMQDGKILDRPAFIAALWNLRAAMFGKQTRRTDNLMVTVSLDSAPTFMRLFELPFVDDKRLANAVGLNLQMVAPGAVNDTAAGWHVISKDMDKARVLISAHFVDRSLIDDLATALREGGFIAVAAEGKALSMVRGIAKGASGVDPAGNYVVVHCDDAGMEFFISRGGILAFTYPIPWSQIADNQGNVSQDAFSAGVTQGFRQIFNFYRQRWTDLPTAILISAGDLFEAVRGIVATETSQPVVPLSFANNGTAADVPVAFGAALRGTPADMEEQEITFLGANAAGIYHQEKMVFFFGFWTAVMPVVLAIVLVFFALGDFVWLKHSQEVAAATAPTVPPQALVQLNTLTAAAQDFNQDVVQLRAAEGSLHPKTPMLLAFQSAATTANVSLSRVVIPIGNGPMIFSGTAGSEDAVIAFKSALASTTFVGTITLPLSAIQPTNGGYSFSMTAAPK